jgi:hypothetical protein
MYLYVLPIPRIGLPHGEPVEDAPRVRDSSADTGGNRSELRHVDVNDGWKIRPAFTADSHIAGISKYFLESTRQFPSDYPWNVRPSE